MINFPGSNVSQSYGAVPPPKKEETKELVFPSPIDITGTDELTALNVHVFTDPLLHSNEEMIAVDTNPHYRFESKFMRRHQYKQIGDQEIAIIGTLGSGTSAKARLIHDLLTDELLVFKHARVSRMPDSTREVWLDFENHNKLTNGRKIWGIQNPPRGVATFVLTKGMFSKSTVSHKGYMVDKYDQDYDGFLFSTIRTLPLEKAMHHSHQLLSAMQHMHELNFVDSDRKFPNVLIKKVTTVNQNEVELVHFSDFGAMRSVDFENNPRLKRSPRPYMGQRVYSPDTAPLSDEAAIARAVKNGNWERVKELEKKWDVFCLGVMLFTMFYNRDPYHRSPEGYFMISKIESQNPNREDVPPALWNLIKSMLNKNPDARPSAEEAMQTFDQILAIKKFREIKQKIISDQVELNYF